MSDKRRPGRPKSTEPHVAVTAWAPVSLADSIARLALKHDVSVSKVVVHALKRLPLDKPT